jgi:2-polyprenyl-3-methyl-5-hydroxy-6-metoxy-1,4-benzoquinol methylase
MDKTERVWDKLAIMFDRVAKRFENTHIKTVENTKKYLHPNAVILDYGCATGTVAIEIADKVKEVHGIDISSKMIDSAKRKANEYKIENIHFSQSSIFNEELSKGTFDVILALNILHFLEDIPKVIQRINELLKPGGVFISVVPYRKQWSLSSIFILSVSKLIGIPYMRFYKVSELEDVLTNVGFYIVASENLTSTEYFIVAKKLD